MAASWVLIVYYDDTSARQPVSVTMTVTAARRPAEHRVSGGQAGRPGHWQARNHCSSRSQDGDGGTVAGRFFHTLWL